MIDMVHDGIWKEGECIFCTIEGFVNSQARLPWLAGLFLLNEKKALRRTLNYIRCEEGNDMEFLCWILNTVSKAKSAKSGVTE